MKILVPRESALNGIVFRGEADLPPHNLPADQEFGTRLMMDLIRIVLSVLLPPVGVFLQVGLGLHFWLNIVLTLCGYIPGLVHAVWIIARTGR